MFISLSFNKRIQIWLKKNRGKETRKTVGIFNEYLENLSTLRYWKDCINHRSIIFIQAGLARCSEKAWIVQRILHALLLAVVNKDRELAIVHI